MLPWRSKTPGAARTTSRPIVFRWDLDKTYLKTEFERLSDLVRIPFEKATDKIDAPGVVELIRGLRRANEAAGREVRIYFLTASPPQIGRAIREKLALDGIEYDGITFKDQLHSLVRGKFRNLREHIGFKLTELLKSRREMPADAREILFGDDWESDPLVYSLYADILRGSVDRALVHDVLDAIRVDPALIADVKRLMGEEEPAEVVERIYINLERRTPPAQFHAYGRRLVPTFNFFQTASSLYAGGWLDLDGTVAVARSLIERSKYSPQRLGNSLADVERRGYLLPTMAGALRERLRAEQLITARVRAPRRRGDSIWQRLLHWVQPTAPGPADAAAPVDYRALVSNWRLARGSAQAQGSAVVERAKEA